jgi:hypothetical protein
MTVTAIDTEIAGMMFMTEGHRLLRRDTDLLPGRPLPKPRRDGNSNANEERADHEEGAEQVIVSRSKDEPFRELFLLRFHKKSLLTPNVPINLKHSGLFGDFLRKRRRYGLV